jgi:O-succinylbenzoic acid--CoA ligase
VDRLSPREAAREAPDRIALVTDERSFSYAELWREAERLLPSVAAEPFVPFVAEPRWENVACAWACLEARVPLVPLHPKWTDADRRAAIDGVARAADNAARGIAAVLFSSGTSAAPRGVLLPRDALLASAAAHGQHLPFVEGDRWLLALPFAHVGGLSIITRALFSRTAVVLSGSSDRAAMLNAIGRHQVSLLSLVPTVAQDLLAIDARHVLQAPRAVLIGGARVPAGLRKKLKSAGVRYLATYGMTETCSQIATQSFADAHDAEAESAGQPLAGFDVRIVDGSGTALAAGERGRIEVRGAAVMSGYLGEAARDPGSYLDTRDVGYLDERGRLFVIGRADETIITGGENVFPSEVEAVIGALPGVREVAAFGVPDERWGEVLAVAIVLEPATEIAAIWREARARLASFRVPRRYALVEALPRSPNGKLNRRALVSLRLALV